MQLKQLLVSCIFCLLIPLGSAAQKTIFDNPILVRQLGLTIDHIYNLEFDKADPLINKIQPKLQDHPAYYLLNAFYVYWKDKPLKIGNPDYERFENYLSKTIHLCDSIFEVDADNVEAGFFSMAAHAYLALLYEENDQGLKALGEAKASYNYILDGFDLLERYPEYYFPCGIYNYYREKYPEEHPFYKPFVWIFRSGDKEKGLEMLKKGVTQAIFAKVESMNYLSHIYLDYENNPELATHYAKMLYKKYPNNPTFIARLADAYLAINNFSGAEPLIEDLIEAETDYYQYVGLIFKGISLENTTSGTDEAIGSLQSADHLGEKLDMRSEHRDSQLYLSLGRAYKAKGDKEKARFYLKKALKNTEYSYMTERIKAELSSIQ